MSLRTLPFVAALTALAPLATLATATTAEAGLLGCGDARTVECYQ